jgi:hypothetical protein
MMPVLIIIAIIKPPIILTLLINAVEDVLMDIIGIIPLLNVS